MAPVWPGFDIFGEEINPLKKQYGQWKKHFAFRPVTTISGRKIWFKTCYKRKVAQIAIIGNSMANEWSVEYGDAFDILRS
jgi:endonuclease YncB( thermonuclease family)